MDYAKSVEERRSVLYEMLYLVLTINLYVFAVVAPLLGGATGIFLMVAGTHPATKSVGRTALICAGVSLMLAMIAFGVWILLVAAAVSS